MGKEETPQKQKNTIKISKRGRNKEPGIKYMNLKREVNYKLPKRKEK